CARPTPNSASFPPRASRAPSSRLPNGCRCASPWRRHRSWRWGRACPWRCGSTPARRRRSNGGRKRRMTSERDLRGNRWGVLGIIMLGTFMAVLDSSIVNVALPHMMSTFGVDREQIEWVATGFMMTSAVVMPLVGWLTNRINYKALYLGSLLLFTLASGACALAWSYESLIIARVLQALGGGAIQPIGRRSWPNCSSRTSGGRPWASGEWAS